MTAAASALGYTPSAVSQQVARLEREASQSLVERKGRRATLTLAGRIVAESANRIVVELEAMDAELQAQTKTVTGVLRVAAFATAARGLLPAAMRNLAQKWPALSVKCVEMDSHNAMRLVGRGTADLAVVHDWLGMPISLSEGLESRLLGVDVSDVIVHANHRLVGTDPVDFIDLEQDMWLYEQGSVAHDFLLKVFQDNPIPGRFTHMISEYATQIEMVGSGLGIALVPRMGRGVLPSSVRALIVQPSPERRIYGVWRTATARRPALVAALDVLKTTCASLETNASP